MRRVLPGMEDAAMADRKQAREAVAEDLRALADDLKAFVEDPKKRARKERGWRLSTA